MRLGTRRAVIVGIGAEDRFPEFHINPMREFGIILSDA